MQIEFNAQQRRDYGPDEVNRLITEYLVENDMNDIHQKTFLCLLEEEEKLETISGFESLSLWEGKTFSNYWTDGQDI